MKKNTILFFICAVFSGIIFTPANASAKQISSLEQAESMAMKKVPGAIVTKSEAEHKKGELRFDVELFKDGIDYDLTYRALDGKLIAYSYDAEDDGMYQDAAGVCGNVIGADKCRRLAAKKVPKGSIVSIVEKKDDGLSIYKVLMKHGKKNYKLKFNAYNGSILEYEWKLSAKKTAPNGGTANGKISLEEAKAIAVKHAGFSISSVTFTKTKQDYEDGLPVYEIEFFKDGIEYEYEILISTGKILKYDRD